MFMEVMKLANCKHCDTLLRAVGASEMRGANADKLLWCDKCEVYFKPYSNPAVTTSKEYLTYEFEQWLTQGV